MSIIVTDYVGKYSTSELTTVSNRQIGSQFWKWSKLSLYIPYSTETALQFVHIIRK